MESERAGTGSLLSSSCYIQRGKQIARGVSCMVDVAINPRTGEALTAPPSLCMLSAIEQNPHMKQRP